MIKLCDLDERGKTGAQSIGCGKETPWPRLHKVPGY